MHERHLARLIITGALCVAAVGSATPASATATYDPTTKTGFVGAADVERAFGWSDRVLAGRAAGLIFHENFWTDETYTVTCGGPEFPVLHPEAYGYFELVAVLARNSKARSYHGKLLGFRLTGARSGISGTTVPPGPGQPCPNTGQPSPTITAARKVSTASRWTLAVIAGDDSHDLLTGR